MDDYNFPLQLNMPVSEEKGEDSSLVANLGDSDNEQFLLGVFDGLGGYSAGFDNQKGGQIASQKAKDISKKFFQEDKNEFNQDNVISLQNTICQQLREDADSKMRESRLRGTLAKTRLCTTIVLASFPSSIGKENVSIKVAWMGDSRAYFLSSHNGLQQLTKDDIKYEKDAFEMITEDPPMSQYITADKPENWQINFQEYEIEEPGFILVCTDGCFQYLPAPWFFEKLLIEKLNEAGNIKEWKNLLEKEYNTIRQDDISLLLYPIGFPSNRFKDFQTSFQERYKTINSTYCDGNDFTSESYKLKLWETYRKQYEKRMTKKEKTNENKEVNNNEQKKKQFCQEKEREVNPEVDKSVDIKIWLKQEVSKFNKNTQNELNLLKSGFDSFIQDNYQKAIEYIEKWLNKGDNFPAYDQYLQTAYRILFLSYFKAGKYKECHNFLKHSMSCRKYIYDITIEDTTSEELKAYAECFLENEEYKEAENIASEMIRRGQKIISYWITTQVYQKQENFEKAKEYQKAFLYLYDNVIPSHNEVEDFRKKLNDNE